MAKMGDKRDASEGEVWFILSTTEICSSLNISKTMLIEIVDQGIVQVEAEKEDDWRFDSFAVGRIRQALRLTHDLGVNLAGAGLALDLLQEIDRLKKLIRIRN